jgi:hypothetical protein
LPAFGSTNLEKIQLSWRLLFLIDLTINACAGEHIYGSAIRPVLSYSHSNGGNEKLRSLASE